MAAKRQRKRFGLFGALRRPAGPAPESEEGEAPPAPPLTGQELLGLARQVLELDSHLCEVCTLALAAAAMGDREALDKAGDFLAKMQAEIARFDEMIALAERHPKIAAVLIREPTMPLGEKEINPDVR